MQYHGFYLDFVNLKLHASYKLQKDTHYTIIENHGVYQEEILFINCIFYMRHNWFLFEPGSQCGCTEIIDKINYVIKKFLNICFKLINRELKIMLKIFNLFTYFIVV